MHLPVKVPSLRSPSVWLQMYLKNVLPDRRVSCSLVPTSKAGLVPLAKTSNSAAASRPHTLPNFVHSLTHFSCPYAEIGGVGPAALALLPAPAVQNGGGPLANGMFPKRVRPRPEPTAKSPEGEHIPAIQKAGGEPGRSAKLGPAASALSPAPAVENGGAALNDGMVRQRVRSQPEPTAKSPEGGQPPAIRRPGGEPGRGAKRARVSGEQRARGGGKSGKGQEGLGGMPVNWASEGLGELQD
jgi:hypothetical protein